MKISQNFVAFSEYMNFNTSKKRNSPNCDPPAKLSNNNNMTHVYIIHIVPKRETQMTSQQNWVVSFSYKGGQGKYTPFQ